MSVFNKIKSYKTPITMILIVFFLYIVLQFISKNIEKNINKVQEIPANTILSAYDSAKYIAKDISSYLNFTPKISVDKVTVINKDTPILELSTLELRDVKHNYSWTNKWLGSEKTIEMNGSFDVKMGFDLNKEFTIDIDDNKKVALITVSEPKILSIELKKTNIDSQNGLINKINDENRNEVINSFISSARRDLNKTVYLEKTKKNLQNVFDKMLIKRLDDFEIKYSYSNQLSEVKKIK